MEGNDIRPMGDDVELSESEIGPLAQVVNIYRFPTWGDDPNSVYIGRKGHGEDGYFGNPFRLAPGSPRGTSIARFEEYARERIATDPEYRERVRGLHGKRLLCFCAPRPCHGDVLAILAHEIVYREVYGE